MKDAASVGPDGAPCKSERRQSIPGIHGASHVRPGLAHMALSDEEGEGRGEGENSPIISRFIRPSMLITYIAIGDEMCQCMHTFNSKVYLIK